MKIEEELGHLAAMGKAITALAAGVCAFGCSPAAIQALSTLATVTAEARLALTERLLAWLGNNYEVPAARSILAAARSMMAEAQFSIDAVKAAEMRAAGTLN